MLQKEELIFDGIYAWNYDISQCSRTIHLDQIIADFAVKSNPVYFIESLKLDQGSSTEEFNMTFLSQHSYFIYAKNLKQKVFHILLGSGSSILNNLSKYLSNEEEDYDLKGRGVLVKEKHNRNTEDLCSYYKNKIKE